MFSSAFNYQAKYWQRDFFSFKIEFVWIKASRYIIIAVTVFNILTEDFVVVVYRLFIDYPVTSYFRNIIL